MKKVVFSDLDGTLLDHFTYSADRSLNTLAQLQQKNIPLVFCSSKTFDEQYFIQQSLGIKALFIVENGSAVGVPVGYFPNIENKFFSVNNDFDLIPIARYNHFFISKLITDINQQLGIEMRGYSDCTPAEIAWETGLDLNAAYRAKMRGYTETLLSGMPGGPALECLQQAGLSATLGGRFATIQDQLVSKGRAVTMVSRWFTDLWGQAPITAGIGDSYNDLSMLGAVDKPYLVQQHNSTWIETGMEGIQRIEYPGPLGFCAAIDDFLD